MKNKTHEQTTALLLTLLLAFSPLLSAGGVILADGAEGDSPAITMEGSVTPGLQEVSPGPEELPDIDTDDNAGAGPDVLNDDGDPPEDDAAIEGEDRKTDENGNPVPAGFVLASADIPDEETDAAETTYAIHIVNLANGAVTADVAQAGQGATVTLTAMPDESCGLVPNSLKVTTDSQNAPRVVRGDGSDGDPFTFTMPDDSVTVRAEFVKYRTIRIADGIANGQISADEARAVKNQLITVSVAPDPGYRLRFNSTLNVANKSLDFTDKSIYYEIADFGGSPYARVAISIPDYGSAIGQPALNCNIGAREYYFYMPDGDVTITAAFARAYDVKLGPSIVGGSINLSGRAEASVGEFVAMNAVADSGYKLKEGSVRVIDDSTGEDAAGIDANGNEVRYTTNYGFIMPDSSVTIVAEFELLPPVEGVLTAVPDDAEVTITWTPAQSFYGFLY
jgi:hypothetical protein